MRKFNVGDRVKVVSGDYGITKIGSYGTVFSVNGFYIDIDFEKLTSAVGYDRGSNKWTVEMRHCELLVGDWDE